MNKALAEVDQLRAQLKAAKAAAAEAEEARKASRHREERWEVEREDLESSISELQAQLKEVRRGVRATAC